MKKQILLFLTIILSQLSILGQNKTPFSDKIVEHNGVAFLPYCKGEVKNKITGNNNSNADKIFSVIASWQPFCPPQGFKLTAFGDNSYLELILDPYFLESGQAITNGGSSATIYFNAPSKIFDIPVVSDIYFKPEKTADFLGYPIYFNGRFETSAISKAQNPLFLPVTREEFLKDLIADEEKKQKEYGTGLSVDESLREMEKAYRELLKRDKVAAAEFKNEMDDYAANLKQNIDTPDLVSLLKTELDKLSPSERKTQAYYSIGAMEKYGNFSGLVPESDKDSGNLLVRPNYSLIEKGKNSIQLIVVKWNLTTTNKENCSPRLYIPKQNVGYEIADNILSELYNNTDIWRQILRKMEK